MAYTFKHGDRPLDEYTIQRAVGRGGFGEVYYAMSDGGREVALKYLRENPQVELRGVGHCINLKSPHLVSIFDVKKNGEGEYFIIMEYCSGPSLRDLLIAEPNGFGVEKAAFFAREIGKGLAYLHERGIVHRDLKPANIFYDDGYVKIGDYGLSKFIAVSRHSAQTASVGTVHYMAPEIGSGNYSRGVDIYALGVILYEMLCGKVPFEGSSMAEVLMKHLTSQPELDNLPQPFARVIRKALEKDPKDRYQTVEDMVGDMLAGEEIQKSLAGFSPRSLEGAVRLGGRDPMESPVPSPNLTPAGKGGFAHAAETVRAAMNAHREAVLPGKVSHKYERISRKIEQRLRKLGGHPMHGFPPGGGLPQTAGEYKKRLLLTLMLIVGLSAGLGVIFGNASGSEEGGAAAGMLVFALSGAVVLAGKAAQWFGVVDGPRWASRMVRACCAAPLLAIACAPMLGGSTEQSGQGLAVFLGLLVVATFADWEKTWHTAWAGEMSFGNAVGKGIGAVVATMIACLVTDTEPDWFVGMSACVAVAGSLIVQTLSWRHTQRPTRGSPPPPPGGPPGMGPAGKGYSDDTIAFGAPPQSEPRAMATNPPYIPGSDSGRALGSSVQAQPRWALTRAFWGIVAFALMGGAIVTFLIPLITRPSNPHDITLAVILCTAFTAFTLFAVRKTGPLKREGFWRETLRPFLISLSLFGIGGTTTGIAREWNCTYGCPEACESEIDRWENEIADLDLRAGESLAIQAQIREARKQIAVHAGPIRFGLQGQEWRLHDRCLSDEGRVGLVSGLVLSSMAFLFLTFLTGRAPRPTEPFLRDGKSGIDRPAAVEHDEVRLHRGPLVLVLGILSLITFLFPFGIAAWVMANHDLAEMHAGRMDRGGMGMAKAGKACGVISVAITIAAMVMAFLSLFVLAGRSISIVQ